MPNAPLIIETALLLLAAFLVGSVAGYGLRRLLAGKPASVSAEAAAVPLATPAGAPEQLVVAPTIAPLAAAGAPKRTPAQRLAAAAQRPETGQQAPTAAETVPAVEPAPQPVAGGSDAIQPARKAGQTTSGKLIPAPVEQPAAPDVMPEEPETAVVAAEVPQIDEAVHVLDPEPEPPPATASAAVQAETPAAEGIDWSELSGRPEQELRSRLEAESERAAMRAIEGGWTPRAAPRRQPVELPEPIADIPRAAGSEPEAAAQADAATADEVAGALSAVRSAVAAASAAADAALAAHAEPEGQAQQADTAGEVAAGRPQGEAHGHAPFGRPTGLATPRDGGKDDLRRIKGLTPQTEAALNGLGIFHFDQIAAWDKKSAVWVDNHLALRGGVARDKWIEQARELAKVRVPGFRAVGKR